MNKYDFVMLYDVENGNPNGDPERDNDPRTDDQTLVGLVTDVCLKRKIRNYVDLLREGQPHYNILIKSDRSLNSKYAEAYDELGLEKGQKGKNREDVKAAREYLCANYYDVRTFGSVMSTGTCYGGKVTGPVQIDMSQSVDPVYPQDIGIIRQAFTTDKEFEEKDGDNTMGRKKYIPYGLYRAEGHVSGVLADKCGFNEDDLELLWEAIINMFEHDRSAARGKMVMRKLLVFKHDSPFGNAPAHKLLEQVTVTRKEGVEFPRKFSDYDVAFDVQLPEGVTFFEKT